MWLIIGGVVGMSRNKTVLRSMDILSLFEEHAELTFQEIIELSQMPKTSVYRMLQSLEEMQFLEKGEDAKYRLGLIFLRFGSLVSARLDLRGAAYPIMKELHEDVEEAINLALKQGDTAVYIEKIDTKQKVRLFTAIGRTSPLYAGACSRSILSFLPEVDIQAYVRNTELKQVAPGTITDKQVLYQSIEQANKDGYVQSNSELENHTSAVAAPIFNHEGAAIAGLSIAGIEAHYTEEQVRLYAEKVMKAANDISKKLGYVQ